MENLLNLSFKNFQTLCVDAGLKKFIAKQVWEWVFNKNKTDFDQMGNISKENQKKLSEIVTINPFKKIDSIPSKEENAIKLILTLEDGKTIEAVILIDPRYNSLCISSQVGCPVDCKFCLTGVVGFKRQLSRAEIVGQVLVSQSMGYPISRIVFMGMGEPLLNAKEVLPAIDRISDPEGFGLSRRKMTVSTAGYMQGLQYLVDNDIPLNLAFSVGSTDPLKRVVFMPLEKRNPLVDVVKLLRKYLNQHNRKLTLEYTLLKGKNDTEMDIKGLINLSKYLDAKINLINLNPHPKIPFEPISSKRLGEIRDEIKRAGAPVTIRYRKGQDITAACGQLGESLL